MKKIKLNFFLKEEKKNGENESAIYGKITVSGTSATFATGKFISKERWHETNKLKNNVKKETNIQSYLFRLKIELEKICTDFYSCGDDNYDAAKIKSLLLGKSARPAITKEKSKMTVLEAIDYHNIYFAKLVEKGEKSKATLDRYVTCKKLVEEFIVHKYNKPDLPIENIDRYFVNNLDGFLRSERKYKDKVGIGNNSTVKYMKNLKTIFNFVEDHEEWFMFNPFKKYHKKLNPVDTVFLEEDELKAIENKKFEILRLETVKNIFLFGCYTALAPVDVMKMTTDNLVTEENGDKWIKTSRTKTGIRASIMLLPPAERIIRDFQNDPRCADSGRLLPKISNQKMNAYLKEIADLCNIKKNLTWYVARHTFATTVTLAHDIPLAVIAAMMGHTSVKQTQHYARIRDEDVRKHMTKLRKKYKK